MMSADKDNDGKFTLKLDQDEYVLFRNMLEEYRRAREERSAFWAALRKQTAWAIVLAGCASAWWALQEWLAKKYGA